MSQWGEQKVFKRGDTIIRIIPNVFTDGFTPVALGDTVDDLILVHVKGDQSIANQMWKELQQKFVGKPYSEWLNQVIEI